MKSRYLAWIFLALATLTFVVRGPLRGIRSGDDLAPPYGGARAWLFGADPYDHDSVNRVLLDAGRERDSLGMAAFNPSLYPPPSFVAMVPFALPGWPVARIAFLVFMLALFAWHVRSARRLAGVEPRDETALWLTGAIVALAPYHTGIALGQVAIPSAALLVVAIERIQRGDERAGGVALAFATLFKPQLAGPFILYYFLRRAPRAAAIALGICVAASVVTVAWLAINDVHWLASWRAATQSVLVPGSQHDPAGPWSAQLLELRPLITAFTGIRSSGAIGFALTLAAGAAVYAAGRRLSARHDLLLLSAVAVLTLFATYHRFYDAAILTIPLAWVFARDGAGWTRPRIAALACCAVFFVPGAWALQVFANEGRIPVAVTQSWVWNDFLLRHQNWALVALFVALALAIRSARRAELPAAAATPPRT